MRTLLLVALVSFVAQQAPEPYPGQGQHLPPPPGWFCSHIDPNPAKRCACKRMVHDEDCEGIPTEEATCKVYCHKQHCHCPVECEVPQKPAPETDGAAHVHEVPDAL